MTCDVHLTRVLGLPAVLRGRSQGHVERAVLENDGHALRGLIVRRGFGGAKWVARDSIARHPPRLPNAPAPQNGFPPAHRQGHARLDPRLRDGCAHQRGQSARQ